MGSPLRMVSHGRSPPLSENWEFRPRPCEFFWRAQEGGWSSYHDILALRAAGKRVVFSFSQLNGISPFLSASERSEKSSDQGYSLEILSTFCDRLVVTEPE